MNPEIPPEVEYYCMTDHHVWVIDDGHSSDQILPKGLLLFEGEYYISHFHKRLDDYPNWFVWFNPDNGIFTIYFSDSEHEWYIMCQATFDYLSDVLIHLGLYGEQIHQQITELHNVLEFVKSAFAERGIQKIIMEYWCINTFEVTTRPPNTRIVDQKITLEWNPDLNIWDLLAKRIISPLK